MKNELIQEKGNVYFIICTKIRCNFYTIFRPLDVKNGVRFNNEYVQYNKLFLPILSEEKVPKADKIAYKIISESEFKSEEEATEYFRNILNTMYIQIKNKKTGNYYIIDFNKDYLSNVLLDNQINKPKVIKNMLELYPLIKENVIGQDDAIKKILTILDYNENVLSYRNKNNILLVGPSGSGKTEIFRTIEELTDTVVCIEDMGQYTSPGYKGADIENMLNHMYIKANNDLDKAEHGILVLDEIDKKITSDKSDPTGTRVIDSLLKLMEGTTFEISCKNGRDDKSYIFNTANLTVVLAGAFVEMVKSKRNEAGFNSKLNNKGLAYSDVNVEKLCKYGFPIEGLRRINIVYLNELSKDDLLNIINNSKYSVLKEYINYFNNKGTKLSISDDALKVIAEDAYNLKIGASGIKAIINKLLDEAMFEVGCNPNEYTEVIIDDETINSIPPYRLVHKKN